MVGPKGPASGSLVRWNLILAGTDELALDLMAIEIGSFNGIKHVPHLRNIFKRGLGTGNLEDIEVVGISLSDAKKMVPKFQPPTGFITRSGGYLTGNMGYKILRKIPVLNPKLCEQCGECSETCPVLNLKKNITRFLQEKDVYHAFAAWKCALTAQ